MKIKALRRVDTVVDMSTPRMSIDKPDIIPVDMSIDSDGNTIHIADQEDQNAFQPQTARRRQQSSSNQEEVFKKLFEELQLELKEKEQRLEIANYRVGQLEANLKESVPLLEHNSDLASERTEKAQLRKSLDAQIMEVDMALNNYKEERFNKRIYLILLFILLLLQPLWFLFPPK